VIQPKRRYLFITQRYIFSGTVETASPTHAFLGKDAMIHYEDVGGDLGEWSTGKRKTAASGKDGKVPGQIVCLLGTDLTPIP
jgi:hypothetical protein